MNSITPKQAKLIKEDYSKVVEYLINEGYTDSKDGADNIINGMSEEWFNMIISE